MESLSAQVLKRPASVEVKNEIGPNTQFAGVVCHTMEFLAGIPTARLVVLGANASACVTPG